MDQRRSDIGQDVKDILETRHAISQKLEMLEHRFHETVEGTKTTVEEVVDRVKDVADDFVVRTKQTFDPTYHIEQRPWAMIGGAIVVGYVLGMMESRLSTRQGLNVPAAPRLTHREDEGSSEFGRPISQQTNLWDEIGSEISGEIEHAKQALIQMGRSFVQDLFNQALPVLTESLGMRRSGTSNDRPQHARGNGSGHQRSV